MNPDKRITAKQALLHPYFIENRKNDPSFQRIGHAMVKPKIEEENMDSMIKEQIEQNQKKMTTVNKIRIKTFSEPPRDGGKLNYSKTQELNLKMSEESQFQEIRTPEIKTCYNVYENTNLYDHLKYASKNGKFKTGIAQKEYPTYTKLNFNSEDQQRYNFVGGNHVIGMNGYTKPAYSYSQIKNPTNKNGRHFSDQKSDQMYGKYNPASIYGNPSSTLNKGFGLTNKLLPTIKQKKGFVNDLLNMQASKEAYDYQLPKKNKYPEFGTMNLKNSKYPAPIMGKHI